MRCIVRNHGFNCLFMYVSSPKYEIFGHFLSEVNTFEMKNFHTHTVFIHKLPIPQQIYLRSGSSICNCAKYIFSSLNEGYNTDLNRRWQWHGILGKCLAVDPKCFYDLQNSMWCFPAKFHVSLSGCGVTSKRSSNIFYCIIWKSVALQNGSCHTDL